MIFVTNLKTIEEDYDIQNMPIGEQFVLFGNPFAEFVVMRCAKCGKKYLGNNIVVAAVLFEPRPQASLCPECDDDYLG